MMSVFLCLKVLSLFFDICTICSMLGYICFLLSYNLLCNGPMQHPCLDGWMFGI